MQAPDELQTPESTPQRLPFKKPPLTQKTHKPVPVTNRAPSVENEESMSKQSQPVDMGSTSYNVQEGAFKNPEA